MTSCYNLVKTIYEFPVLSQFVSTLGDVGEVKGIKSVWVSQSHETLRSTADKDFEKFGILD